jgi:hypothetical protein
MVKTVAPVEPGPRYRLLSQHFSEEDKLLEPGTEVGAGTPHKWTRPPTVEMEALNDEAEELLVLERERSGETLDPLNSLPMTMDGSNPPQLIRQVRPKPGGEHP